MHRVLYLLLVPIILLILFLPFAARGVALPFAPFNPSLPQVVQALVGWIFISLVAFGIARRWRMTRVIIAITFIYFLSLAFYSFWHGSFAWPLLLVRLVCYSFAAWLAYALASPMRRAS